MACLLVACVNSELVKKGKHVQPNSETYHINFVCLLDDNASCIHKVHQLLGGLTSANYTLIFSSACGW